MEAFVHWQSPVALLLRAKGSDIASHDTEQIALVSFYQDENYKSQLTDAYR